MIKHFTNHRFWLFLIIVLSLFSGIGCNTISNTDSKKFIANYERDKAVPNDSLKAIIKKVENSGGWIISLKEKALFRFKKNDTIINGTWTIEQRDGEDYYLKFQFDNNTVEGRLNGTIIYFDKPTIMFDSIFRYVNFVKTTRKIDL